MLILNGGTLHSQSGSKVNEGGSTTNTAKVTIENMKCKVRWMSEMKEQLLDFCSFYNLIGAACKYSQPKPIRNQTEEMRKHNKHSHNGNRKYQT